MCGIPGLLGVLDVAKCKTIKSRDTWDPGIYDRDWDEDSPSDGPNGEEHKSHRAKEANEEVGI